MRSSPRSCWSSALVGSAQFAECFGLVARTEQLAVIDHPGAVFETAVRASMRELNWCTPVEEKMLTLRSNSAGEVSFSP